jgi:hypothetical protein
MFVVRAKVFEVHEYVEKNFGVFSTREKAQEAIDILVQRFRETEGPDDEELDWMVDDYRRHFSVIPLPGVDNLDFFHTGDIPYF